MLLLAILLTFQFNGISYDEVEYAITPDNYMDYRGRIPDRVFNSYELALAEPDINQPCIFTVWYRGDSMLVSWQGAVLSLNQTWLSLLFDSLRITLPLPTWYYNMELYRNGSYVETLLPMNLRDRMAPLCIDSLTRSGGSFMSASYPGKDIREYLTDSSSGFGYQIRMILWDQTDEFGNVDNTRCLELWSHRFMIADPWIEVVDPSLFTVWREDSLDVRISYITYGLFGRESAESIRPIVRLFHGNEEITTISLAHVVYEDSSLRCTIPVASRWGNGLGFRICLEVDGNRFFSKFFGIYGQTIKILKPEPYLLPLNSTMEIEWCSLSNPDIRISLFGIEIEPRPSSGTEVTFKLYRVAGTSGSLEFLSTLAAGIQNDGFFIYGKSYEKDWIGENLRLKIVDSDGNYGWSEYFYIDQQRGWF